MGGQIENILFTPGPVPVEKHILDIGSRQLPYNRTTEFSRLTEEILGGLKYVFQTSGSIAILTGSGTAAMEASVLNFLHAEDKVLIINGGTFGQRWCDLCEAHSIPFEELILNPGEDVNLEGLEKRLSEQNFTALLINAHETSTGILYDIEAIGKITHALGLFFIVDAVSMICADPFQMDEWHVDVAILSSQKALALPPGLSFVAMNSQALDRLRHTKNKTLYFNLQDYLDNQARGQLPYTPAIGILLQLHQRLIDIQAITLDKLILQHKKRADDFRKSLIHMPFDTLPERPSNAMTALVCSNINAYEIVLQLRNFYGIEVAPNAGDLKARVFRVSHMGSQHPDNIKALISGLKEICEKYVAVLPMAV